MKTYNPSILKPTFFNFHIIATVFHMPKSQIILDPKIRLIFKTPVYYNSKLT